MHTLLLTGAGFSRNWGGWLAAEAFEYLLGSPQITNNRRLCDLLWKHHAGDGFEGALAEVQRAWITNPHAHIHNLLELQAAVGSMFEDMNAGLAAATFEFQTFLPHTVKNFLARFDAIFTLNQDLLLENHYCTGMELMHPQKWIGCEFPGMVRQRSLGGETGDPWARCRWSPVGKGAFSLTRKSQPIYKLHGSSNWIATYGEPLMIIGGNKSGDIARHPVLSQYFSIFEEKLAAPETRLMVIGYGFRDTHINEVLVRELNRGLKLFVISPDGAAAARAVSPTLGAAITQRSSLEEAFTQGLIGASRRGLREIFGGDNVEFEKVMRFFSISAAGNSGQTA